MIALRRELARYLGVVPRWLAARLDPPLLVLLYHRVAQLPSDPQSLAVTPLHFKEQLELIKSRHPIVRLDQLETPKVPSVAITFDDGYADNVTTALPILEALQIPATFFVTVGAIGQSEEFWWDELERLILTPLAVPPKLRLSSPGYEGSWRTRTPVERKRAYRELQGRLRKATPSDRGRCLTELRSWAGLGTEGRPSHRPLSQDELRRLSQSPWAGVGSHGHSHAALASLDPEAQRLEIEGSRRTLMTWVGRDVDLYAYPFGAPGDYPKEAPDLCRKAGYTRAFANRPGVVHAWTDGYQLPRQLVRDWPLRRFRLELLRFWVS